MSKRDLLLFVSLILLTSCTLVANPVSSSTRSSENLWVSKAEMNEARSGLGVAVVNGKIYAIGGSTEHGKWTNFPPSDTFGEVVRTNEEYNPLSNTWTRRTPMLTPRSDFSVAVCQNKIYCIGGFTRLSRTGPDVRTDKIEFYDPEKNIWVSKTSMPTPREDFETIVYGCKIYLIGGTSGLNQVYDPLTNTWENKTSMPTPNSAKANLVNGKIYFVGGDSGSALTQVYDPATDTWEIKAPMPTAVDGFSVAVDTKIYVVGNSLVGGAYSPLNRVYDTETDTWSQGASIPSVDGGAAFVFVTTGKMAPKRVYVLNAMLQIYDPETDSWTFGNNMPTPRIRFGFALVDDILYAIGGMTYELSFLLTQITGGSVTPYATTEQYTPLGYGTVPPVITSVSPQNQTYNTTTVSLFFTVNRPVAWMGYSLDHQNNVTITGNFTLTDLVNGEHQLTLYATDTEGTTGTSDTIYFIVDVPSATWTLTSLAVTIAAIVAVTILAYIRKKHTPQS